MSHPCRLPREGASEIGLAVMATTLSIVAVFVPVAFMKGIVGKFFFEFGITVTVAVLVSPLCFPYIDPHADIEIPELPPKHGKIYMLLEKGFDKIFAYIARSWLFRSEIDGKSSLSHLPASQPVFSSL